MLSQGPSAPAQFLLMILQLYTLSFANTVPRNAAKPSSGPRLHWRRLLPSMLYWGASAGLHFYSSGHDHIFSTIEFSCAYIGLHKFHLFFSGAWAILNVGAFHIFHFLGVLFIALQCHMPMCPISWRRLPHDVAASTNAHKVEASGAKVSDTEGGLSARLRGSLSYFGLWFAVEAVAAAGCAALHRRHLFVWVS